MLHKLKVEVENAIPAIIFFVISLNLINFTEGLMFRADHIETFSVLTVTVFALFLGKFLIIVNAFSFMNAYPDKPLIYNIVWKMMIYIPLVFLFRLSERFLEDWIKDGDLDAALSGVSHAFVSPIFWSVQMWVVMLFVIYVVCGEFIRVVGKDRVMKMMFG